jgi:DNA-binding transcriptional ArsR family regulator
MPATQAFDHVDERAAELFAALSDPTRIDMIRLMVAHGPGAPRSMFEDELALAKATVGYHLSILRTAQLISVHHAGSSHSYSLRIDSLERAVPALLQHLRGEETVDTAGSE